MRKLPLSVTISAALHVAAVAWFATHELTHRSEPPPALTQIEIVDKAPEPMAVQFLDESTTRSVQPLPAPPVATQPAITRSEPASRESKRTGASTPRTSGTPGSDAPGTEPGTEPGGPKGPHSKYFAMRAGDRPDLSMPGATFRDDLDHAPAGTAPQRGVEPSGELESAAGGRHKSDQNVFVAKVDRDGTVKLTDKRNLSAKLSLNPANLLSGRFDVTDWAMRSTGNDPYASRKLKFLDDTREERAEIGIKYREQQLAQATRIMRKNLEQAWASLADFAQRKQALFDLWDEVAEPDGSDELLAAASRAARKAVIGFIRAHLPPGSEYAYSASELVALNGRKKSAQPFAPYD